MLIKKNIVLGKNKLFLFIILIFLFNFSASIKKNSLQGEFVEINVLDKVNSKKTNLKLKINEEIQFQNLIIKAKKCENSEFDDNPEVTAYLQVIDATEKDKDKVFVFNGWTFSSSPTLRPFDHPVYDIWLIKCYN